RSRDDHVDARVVEERVEPRGVERDGFGGRSCRPRCALHCVSSEFRSAPSLPDRDRACHYPRRGGTAMPAIGNLLADLSPKGAEEEFTQLLRAPAVRIERIVSHGHASPPGFWYDQDRAEWVLLLQGAAILTFEREAEPIRLAAGDHVHIPAHARHRVEWTDPARPTVWLAVHYG